MTSRIYWVRMPDTVGDIGIMARPRGGTWLEEEISGLSKQDINIVVSLLEREEIFELSLQEEGKICREYNIDYINLPIPDRGIPPRSNAFEKALRELGNKFDSGQKIVIHCRMGIGRSSIIAGALLLQAGHKAESILKAIEKSRGLSIPDTIEQKKWLISRH